MLKSSDQSQPTYQSANHIPHTKIDHQGGLDSKSTLLLKHPLNQDFTAYRPGQIWASDIAYIKTMEGILYLAVILDLFTRKIVGWSLAPTLKDVLTAGGVEDSTDWTGGGLHGRSSRLQSTATEFSGGTPVCSQRRYS